MSARGRRGGQRRGGGEDVELGTEGDPAPLAIADGGWGVEWTTTAGGLQPVLSVVSDRRVVDQWLKVMVTGNGPGYSFQLGPYPAEGAQFTVPLTLDARADMPGFVQVNVIIESRDAVSGELHASRQARPAFVLHGGTGSEAWYDEARALDLARAALAGHDLADLVLDSAMGVDRSPALMRSLLLLLLAACAGGPAGKPDATDAADTAVTPDGDTTDTPTVTTPTEEEGPHCVDGDPCSVDLAAATWNGGPRFSWTGYSLEAGAVDGTPVLLTGSPTARVCEVSVLAAADLTYMGTWYDEDPLGSSFNSQFGETVRFGPDEHRVAVGARNGASTGTSDGVVYLLAGLPAGDSAIEPVLSIYGDYSAHFGFGADIAFLDLAGTGTDLVVGSGNADPGWPNGIFRFEETLTGVRGEADATDAIMGNPIFGQRIAGWDGDGDGLAELLSSVEDGVVHFTAPWIGGLTEEDGDVRILERAPEDQLGSTIEVLGDLDADGRADLAVTADTYSAEIERQGALWVANAVPVTSDLAERLPFAFLGVTPHEGCGTGVTSGDFNDDGNPDIVVGCAGFVTGYQTGHVLGFYGPLTPGVRTIADADFIVNGEVIYDGFGNELATLPQAGADDLVVSALQWNDRGRVYLFHGADIAP